MNPVKSAFVRRTAILAAAVTVAAGAAGDAAAAPLRLPVTMGHVRSEELPDDDRLKAGYNVQLPLTGLISNGKMEDRPIAVMVENSAAARPQSGLADADMVVEILAEGSITRFVAVYHSRTPARVGPVRSIRPYYVDVAAAMDAVLVHAGWSQEAMNKVVTEHVDHFDEVYGDGRYYWRSADRKAPHNLYTSIEGIRLGMEKKRIRAAWTPVSPVFLQNPTDRNALPAQAGPSGPDGDAVRIPYSAGYTVSYVYDSASGLYLRRMNGSAHTDAETGRQLAAANVLICRSTHRIVDGAGRRQVDVRGPGSGYVLTGGRAQEAVWELKDGLIRARTEAGGEIPLTPGQTWIQFVPEGAAVELQ